MKKLYIIFIPLSIMFFIGLVRYYSHTQNVIIKDRTGTYHIQSYATAKAGDRLIKNIAVKALKACLNKKDGHLENKKLFSCLFFPSIQSDALIFNGKDIQEQSARIQKVTILNDNKQQIVVGLKGLLLTHSVSGTSCIRPFNAVLTFLDLSAESRSTQPFIVKKIVFKNQKEKKRDI